MNKTLMTQELSFKSQGTETRGLLANIPGSQFFAQPRFRFIRRLIFISASICLGFVFFFAGLRHYFPGDVLAKLVQQHVAAGTSIPLSVKDIQLGWNSIQIPELSVNPPATMTDVGISKLLVIKQIQTTLLPLLILGRLTVNAEAYSGKLRISTDIRQLNVVKFSLKDLVLDNIPLLNTLEYAFLSGKVTLFGQLTNWRALQTRKQMFPQGQIQGNIKNFGVRIKNFEKLSQSIGLEGIEIPTILITDFRIDLELGEVISLKQVKLEGDLEGTISGSVRLDQRNLNESQLDLHVKLKPSDELMKGLASFSIILREYQCGNDFDVEIKGRLGQLDTIKRRRCT
ncbi:type II secretion system protein GspN [Deltaproteobacteria bacterium TL4]